MKEVPCAAVVFLTSRALSFLENIKKKRLARNPIFVSWVISVLSICIQGVWCTVSFQTSPPPVELVHSSRGRPDQGLLITTTITIKGRPMATIIKFTIMGKPLMCLHFSSPSWALPWRWSGTWPLLTTPTSTSCPRPPCWV